MTTFVHPRFAARPAPAQKPLLSPAQLVLTWGFRAIKRPAPLFVHNRYAA